MTKAKNPSKAHHFVPRSLLKYFCPPGEEDFIYAYNKRTAKSFRPSLKSAGSENGYNTIKDGGHFINFEGDFDTVDSLLAIRLGEAHAHKGVFDFPPEQRQDWADLVAVQLLRTPIIRSTLKTFMPQLQEQVAEYFGAGLDMPIPDENDVRKASRELFAEREKMRLALTEKDMVLFSAQGDTLFRISDRPVTLQSLLPYGEIGLSSHGIAIFMPLGQRLMLGLLCPSIRRSLNKAALASLAIPEDVRARLNALKVGLETGAVIQLDETMVKRHNEQQFGGCMCFIYGPTENFEDVRAFLSVHPEALDVQSAIRFGRMGGGLEPKPHMPMGSWIVLIGRSESHMLEVSDASEGEPLDVLVRSQAALEAAMLDQPFSVMHFYVDQHQLRGMRNVCLIQAMNQGECRVQVRHSDPGLDALMNAIS